MENRVQEFCLSAELALELIFQGLTSSHTADSTLPDDAKPVVCVFDPVLNRFHIRVYSESFAIVPECGLIPEINVTVTRLRLGKLAQIARILWP